MRDLIVMRDDQDRRAKPAVQLVHQLENLGAGFRIQVPGGLVAQQNRRIEGQRARNRDPLALAAGKLVRQVIDGGAGAFLMVLDPPSAVVNGSLKLQ